MDSILILFFFIVGGILLISPILIFIGLIRHLQKHPNKDYTLKLITYGVIGLVIGLGTCGLIGIFNF